MKEIVSLFIFIVLLSCNSTFSQTKIEGTEIGFDGSFSVSNLGGTYGIGTKFGFKLNENVILGPSIRFQRTWSTFAGGANNTVGYSIFGGGVWLHYRFANYLFAGAEVEMLNTPNDIIFVTGQKVWVPTAFIGGGYSHAFDSGLRLNAGVFYDVIDNPRSPFRPGYFMQKNTNGVPGALIPVIYRLGIFIPLN